MIPFPILLLPRSTQSLDATNIPVTGRFTLGGTTATVSSVAVSAANKTVTLTLSAAVKSTDTITVSYTDPTTGNDVAAIQDANINPAFVSAQAPLQKQQANIQVYGAAYAELFKNLEMARFQYLKGMPFMQIIDAADYPMQKNKVSKLKMGLFFSFLAMFILAFMLGVFTYKKMMA